MSSASVHAGIEDANKPASATVDTALAGSAHPTAAPAVDLSLEPDWDAFLAIYTGRLVWTRSRTDKPVVPYEDLPFPDPDGAKVPPCSVRWQFTGRFNLNQEEDIARGSIRFQIRRFLGSNGITNVQCRVNFPRGGGRWPFVDVTVPAGLLQIVKDAPLLFHGAALQRMFIGPSLDRTALVVEVLGFPIGNALKETGRYIAQSLSGYVQVHDVWVVQVSYANDPSPPKDTNHLQLLVTVPPGKDGEMDPIKQHAIPGFLRLGKCECELQYSGRLEWCTTCKSAAEYFHSLANCPRRRYYNCGGTGHTYQVCTEEAQGDAAMAVQQAEESNRGSSNLNYGSA